MTMARRTCSVPGVLPSSAAAFPLQTHRSSSKSRPRPTRLRPWTGAPRSTCTVRPDHLMSRQPEAGSTFFFVEKRSEP